MTQKVIISIDRGRLRLRGKERDRKRQREKEIDMKRERNTERNREIQREKNEEIDRKREIERESITDSSQEYDFILNTDFHLNKERFISIMLIELTIEIFKSTNSIKSSFAEI